MASFHLDNDVAVALAPVLRVAGHTATTARDLGMQAATDADHLLASSQRQCILITHNQRDFVLLHRAWLTWARAWHVDVTHNGIIMLPQRPVSELADLVQRCLSDQPQVVGEAFRYTGGRWVAV